MQHARHVFVLLQAAQRLRVLAAALDDLSGRAGTHTIQLSGSDADVCEAGADAIELIVEALGHEEPAQ